MTSEIPQVRAVGQLPTAGQTEYILPAAALDGAQIGLAGKVGSGNHYDALTPGRWLKPAPPAAQLDVRLSSALRIQHDRADRDAQPSPVRHNQQQRVTEHERLMLSQPRVVR